MPAGLGCRCLNRQPPPNGFGLPARVFFFAITLAFCNSSARSACKVLWEGWTFLRRETVRRASQPPLAFYARRILYGRPCSVLTLAQACILLNQRPNWLSPPSE